MNLELNKNEFRIDLEWIWIYLKLFLNQFSMNFESLAWFSNRFGWILNQFGMNIESIWNELGLDLELISNWFGINLKFFGTKLKSKWLWVD